MLAALSDPRSRSSSRGRREYRARNRCERHRRRRPAWPYWRRAGCGSAALPQRKHLPRAKGFHEDQVAVSRMRLGETIPRNDLFRANRGSRGKAPALRAPRHAAPLRVEKRGLGSVAPDLARPTGSSRPRTRRRPPRIEANPLDVNGTAFAAANAGLARARRREMRHGRDCRDRRPSDSPFAKAQPMM